MKNFWKTLPKPFLILAPMDDVTDVVFREVIHHAAAPDIYFTEFTSADAICSEGRPFALPRLKFSKNQHPVVAQIWGKNPQNMYECAKLINELGFDGIDLNMGCPDKSVVKKGSGAGLIKSFSDTASVIKAVREGAGKIPVSVKTRIGFDKVITEDWLTHLLSQNLDALIIHGRIAVEMSKSAADWQEIGKAVGIRYKISPETLIIGNGDIINYTEVVNMHKIYGIDGVMIGRGIFSDPWVFAKEMEKKERSTKEYLELFELHIRLFKKTWGSRKHFAVLRRFLKMYIRGFKGADFLRQKLYGCENIDDLHLAVSKELQIQTKN